MKKQGRKWKITTVAAAVLILYVIVFDVFVLNSTKFCDWYISHVFAVWIETIARVTGCVPFSVGEVMIVLGVCLCIIEAISLVVFLLPKKKQHKEKVHRWLMGYQKLFGWVLLCVMIVMSQNCFVLYHATPFEEIYLTKGHRSKEQVARLYEKLLGECNRLSQDLNRDENDDLIFSDNLEEEAIRAMKNLEQDYPRLKGYYPKAKKIFFSKFLSQQYLEGVYFPFSLEVNYNQEMYIVNTPFTICHELAHLKGFIREDEANFIAYLACVRSGNEEFIYSGCYEMLYYLSDEVYELGIETDMQMNELAAHDDMFLSEEAWEKVESTAIFDTYTVSKASDVFLETSLQVNGVEEGMESYCKVVELLLDYYADRELETDLF